MVANPTSHEEDDAQGGHAILAPAAMAFARDALPVETRVVWDDLVAFDKTNLRDVLIRALAAYWSVRLEEESHRAYKALQANSSALAAYEQEREELDGTLMDGLGRAYDRC